MLTRLLRLGVSAAVAIGLAFPQSMVHAQRGVDPRARITGSWRVVSFELEFQDGTEHRFPLGAHPNGYILFGFDGRMMTYLEAEGRKPPQTDEERSSAYRTLNAYTGRYRVEGDKWITRVDGAWNVEWVGTDQERSFVLDGDRLNVVAQWNRNALYGGKMTRGHLVFEREKSGR
jgi:hypothetical protein